LFIPHFQIKRGLVSQIGIMHTQQNSEMDLF
jgi:hypothetical protein